MRDEVLVKYTDPSGTELEAYRVGESFGVREIMEGEDNIALNIGDQILVGTHMIVFLSSGFTLPVPGEDLAWFYVDQLAIHADGLETEDLSTFMGESAEWASHVLESGERITYAHWKREHI